MVHLFQDNQRGSPSESRTGPVLFHGCLSDRMGSQLERLPHLGILDYRAPGVPHKLVRDGSSRTSGSPLGFLVASSKAPPVLKTTAQQLLTFGNRGAPYSGTLFTKTVELLHLSDLHHIILTPTHLPESRNVTADALPIMNSPSPPEWRLHRKP